MTRVLHLLDGAADWEQRLAVSQLLRRIPPTKSAQWVASLDARVPEADWFDGAEVERLPLRLAPAWVGAAAIERVVRGHEVDVIHAWGLPSAKAATAAAATARATVRGLVYSRFDPLITDADAKFLRAFASGPRSAIACAGEIVRRRLIEKGVDAGRCVVIRPGVDFAVINEAKRDQMLRDGLGLSPNERVILASHPVRRDGGHERVVWGGQLAHYLDPKWRTVVYGRSAECERLRRLSDGMPFGQCIVWAGDGRRFEELIAIADALVITPPHDVSTTLIAWAMAASTAVIGSAVYSIAELIAHKQSGRLIKPERGPAMAVRIAHAIRSVDEMGKEKEFARGAAFQAFAVSRFADQSARLYQNLLTAAPPADGIVDSAMT